MKSLALALGLTATVVFHAADAIPGAGNNGNFMNLPTQAAPWIANRPCQFRFKPSQNVNVWMNDTTRMIVTVEAHWDLHFSKHMSALDQTSQLVVADTTRPGEFIVHGLVPGFEHSLDRYYVKIEIPLIRLPFLESKLAPTLMSSGIFPIVTLEDAKKRGLPDPWGPNYKPPVPVPPGSMPVTPSYPCPPPGSTPQIPSGPAPYPAVPVPPPPGGQPYGTTPAPGTPPTYLPVPGSPPPSAPTPPPTPPPAPTPLPPAPTPPPTTVPPPNTGYGPVPGAPQPAAPPKPPTPPNMNYVANVPANHTAKIMPVAAAA